MSTISIALIDPAPARDADLQALLTLVYVDGGFTSPHAAADGFLPANVRTRGDVLVATDVTGALVGCVVVVFADSPARRFATAGEAELHLLAVHPDQRGTGVGSSLVDAAIARARQVGAHRMILWTQPSMTVAQRLYARHGFKRVPAMDFSRGERSFLVFAQSLSAPHGD